MCGYLQRSPKSTRALMALIEAGYPHVPPQAGRFWPGTTITDVAIQKDDGVESVQAVWWFLLKPKDGELKANRDVTCFNARNLDSKMWATPFKIARCVIPATAIVETKGKQSYLMEAADGLLLGGLYREWQIDGTSVYSCAVITCEPHARFSTYHDKSIPLFLPPDPKLLRLWLDPTFTDADYFRGLISPPRLPVSLQVAAIKNSQHVEPLSPFTELAAD